MHICLNNQWWEVSMNTSYSAVPPTFRAGPDTVPHSEYNKFLRLNLLFQMPVPQVSPHLHPKRWDFWRIYKIWVETSSHQITLFFFIYALQRDQQNYDVVLLEVLVDTLFSSSCCLRPLSNHRLRRTYRETWPWRSLERRRSHGPRFVIILQSRCLLKLWISRRWSNCIWQDQWQRRRVFERIWFAVHCWRQISTEP